MGELIIAGKVKIKNAEEVETILINTCLYVALAMLKDGDLWHF
ncbi:hypothetical protein [Dolichospermum compactum]|nr:hypothetical protein [Dolichospermum compactum]